ncbi:hypothetical protein REPUB_Repub10bG0108700 [Reevesia pubescens]
MANVQFTKNLTKEQLDAIAGSEALRYQATSFGMTQNNKIVGFIIGIVFAFRKKLVGDSASFHVIYSSIELIRYIVGFIIGIVFAFRKKLVGDSASFHVIYSSIELIREARIVSISSFQGYGIKDRAEHYVFL